MLSAKQAAWLKNNRFLEGTYVEGVCSVSSVKFSGVFSGQIREEEEWAKIAVSMVMIWCSI